MWDLEYFLLFGVPGNKTEIFRGKGRWVFPFLQRDQCEAHFDSWMRTLCRWQDVHDLPVVVKDGLQWKTEFAEIELALAPRPIEMRMPIDGWIFEAFYHSFFRRELWPDQPADRQVGYDSFMDAQDVQIKLYFLFAGFAKTFGGESSGRTAIAMSNTAAVEPDAFYFAKTPDECMIRGDYFQGVPDLVAEVLTPASRFLDRGTRMEVYRRHGMRHLWLIDPPVESIEVYELDGRSYRQTGTYHCGETFHPALFPDQTVDVDPLFMTQIKNHRVRFGETEKPRKLEPIPEWMVAPEKQVGLEYFFYLGHPEKRWEIWNNRAPNVLAFGSSAEARHRFRHFLEEICRWEQAAVPRSWTSEADREEVEIGRFHLTRRGRLVYLDVAVDARKYREMLYVCSHREAWDWGERAYDPDKVDAEMEKRRSSGCSRTQTPPSV
jgi:hypothetical protein